MLDRMASHVQLLKLETAPAKIASSQFRSEIHLGQRHHIFLSHICLLHNPTRQDGCYVQRCRPAGRITLGASVPANLNDISSAKYTLGVGRVADSS